MFVARFFYAVALALFFGIVLSSFSYYGSDNAQMAVLFGFFSFVGMLVIAVMALLGSLSLWVFRKVVGDKKAALAESRPQFSVVCLALIALSANFFLEMTSAITRAAFLRDALAEVSWGLFLAPFLAAALVAVETQRTRMPTGFATKMVAGWLVAFLLVGWLYGRFFI